MDEQQQSKNELRFESALFAGLKAFIEAFDQSARPPAKPPEPGRHTQN